MLFVSRVHLIYGGERLDYRCKVNLHSLVVLAQCHILGMFLDDFMVNTIRTKSFTGLFRTSLNIKRS